MVSMKLTPTQISFLKYLIVGGGALLIYIVGTSVSVEILNWSVMLSNIGFYTGVTLFSYLCNYYWSFGASGTHIETLAKYVVLAGIGVGLNALFVYVMTPVLNVPIYLSTVMFCVLWPVASFLIQKKYVYN